MSVLAPPAVASPAAGGAPAHRFRTALLAGGVVFAVRMAVALLAGHPLLPAEETGYIVNAQWLAGIDQTPLPTLPGYSILLAPVLALSDDLDTVLRSAQVLNSLLGAASALLTFRLLRLLVPAAGPALVAILAVTLNLYSSFTTWGSVAIAENLLVPASVALAVAFAGLEGANWQRRAVLASIGAGVLAGVHPTGVALAAGTAVALAAQARREQRSPAVALAPLVTAAAVLAIVAATTDSAAGTVMIGTAPHPSWTDLVTDNLDLRALATLPLTLLGQAFYLAVASWGLAVLGAVGVARHLRSENPVLRSIATWTAAGTAATLALSALVMNQATGSDAIHGRTVEAVSLPLLATGAALLLSGTGVQLRRLVILAPPVAAALLLVTRGPDAFDVPLAQHLTVPAVRPLVELADGIHLPTLAVGGALGAGLLFLGVGRWPRAALAVLALAFAAIASGAVAWTAGDLDDVAADRSLVAVLRTHVLSGGVGRTCISLDTAQVDDPEFREGYRLALLDARVDDWDSTGSEAPCSDIVISPRPDLSASWPGAVLLEAEEGARQLLWVLPGPAQSSLPPDRRNLETPTAPLPDGPVATVEILEVDPASGPPDEQLDVRVRFTNRSLIPFVPSGSIPGGNGGVTVGLEWREPGPGSSLRLDEPRRVHLPRILWPGESIELGSTIRPLLSDGPLEPGTWLLHAEMVQEGVRWYGDDVSDSTPVEVTGEAEDPLE